MSNGKLIMDVVRRQMILRTLMKVMKRIIAIYFRNESKR